MDTSLLTALGARSARPLAKQLDLHTVGDLVRRYPRRYINTVTTDAVERDDVRPEEGQHVTLLARVHAVTSRRMQKRPGTITTVAVVSSIGPIECTYFNQLWRRDKFPSGRRVLVSGDLERFRGKWRLTFPELVPLDEDDGEGGLAEVPRLLPVYPATHKLRSMAIFMAVKHTLALLDHPDDLLPARLRAEHDLPSLAEALRRIHLPETDADHQGARRRLVWDEAFGLQLALQSRRFRASERPAGSCPPRADGIAAAFHARLPFVLTASQEKVGASLSEALAGTEPMNRLLQGDVGSGKTLVALRAMLQVVDSGRQAVLLAPTEVLAGQHARSLRTLLGPLAHGGELALLPPLRSPCPLPSLRSPCSAEPAAEHATTVTLLTGSLGVRQRRQALLDVQSGVAGIVVGTHAVIQQSVGFHDLGLVVVDEQHRFGVHQRDELRSRVGETTPHVLVMTATPIPRTVALTVYGDLDAATLDELPPGRRPVETRAVPAGRVRWMQRVWERVREEIAAGHQAFVVCPRIGGDEVEPGADERPTSAADLAPDGALDDQEDAIRAPLAVTEVGPALAAGELTGLRLAVLHGRLPAEEKDELMRSFSAAEIDVLVATTVVEVGVDVPNATVMVVLDAERFGVSQLHQLRGRVGRGAAPSSCFLVSEAAESSSALQRLERLAATSDGFEVARIDLEVRGEGDVLGADQSGGPAGRESGLHIVSVRHHLDVIDETREAAREVLRADPTLAEHAGLAALARQVVGADDAAFLDRR